MKDALTIAITSFSPLVIQEGDGYTGFEIELWEKIADELGWNYEYSEYVFSEIFPALVKGEADVGLAGITINEERERTLDFSHQTLDSGLRILVPAETGLSIRDIIKSVFSRDIRNIIFLLLGFVVIAGHALWLAERGSETIGRGYIPGIFDAFWWAIVTVSTIGYGDIVPYTLLGRFIGALVILIGLAIFGLYIARISASMTLRGLRSDIKSHEDLKGRNVATVEGTTSVAALKGLGARVVGVASIKEAYSQLGQEKVEAVVFDSPVLLRYAHNEGRKKVRIAGDLFENQAYGIAFKEGSKLREPTNRTLLKLRETGYYDSLYEKWFGK